MVLALLILPAGGVLAQTVFTNQAPFDENFLDSANYELGMTFSSKTAGTITAIRYWKAPDDNATHMGRIWPVPAVDDPNPTEPLAKVTFAVDTDTGSGWQQQALTTPLKIDADTTYTVSVNSTGGAYAFAPDPDDPDNSSDPSALPVTNGDLTGSQGVFIGNPGSFPNQLAGIHYFRDVLVAVPGNCISGEKFVRVTSPDGPFVRNSVTAENRNSPPEQNPLIAYVPEENLNDLPMAIFGGDKVFYQFVITNCGTVPLFNVRVDDCIDKRSVGAEGFLVGGVGPDGEENCEQPRLIPPFAYIDVGEDGVFSPGESVTLVSDDFGDDPINPNSSDYIDICQTYGGSRVDGIVRNDVQFEAEADTNGDGSGDTFVFFDELNLVQCKKAAAALGDRVWEDLNANGIQDCVDTNDNGIIGDAGDTEPECGTGVPDATVYLRTPDGQGDCTGAVQQTTATDEQGFYLFDDLTPGAYCVEFERPDICDGALAYFTQANVGGNVAVDSDANPETGLTGPVTLAAGQSNLTLDAGVYCPAKLGDRIWLDENQDGDQNCTGVNPANPGQVIPNGGAICDEPTFDQRVAVSLTDCAGGSALDINGNSVPAQDTVDGRYLFDNLKPGGSYCVQFTRPAGYNCTTPNALGVGYQVNSDGLPANGLCNTARVALPSGGDDRSWDLGLVLPPTNCDLKVQKTCEVLPPPSTGPFVCKDAKPLDVLAMINGSGQTVSNIRVYRDKFDPKNPVKNLMYTLEGPFDNGAEVTAAGYAAADAKNDVDWVFEANGATYISRFHRSCSDDDMDGPEDCGLPQGNAKSTSTSLEGLPVLNTWALEGLAGNGLAFDCTVDPVEPAFPTADACSVFLQDQPSCETEGKPTELVFEYTVTPPNSLCTISNTQEGKATCSVTGAFNPAQDALVQAAGNSSLTKDVYTVVPTTVNPDGSVTVTFKGGSDFKSTSYFRLSQGNNRVDLELHTSCSKPLAVGDVFGPLTLVGFNGVTGGTPVLYGYELQNDGDAVNVSEIMDDELGEIDGGDCGPWPFDLPSGESRRCTQEGTVTQTTTNTVTVTATLLANGDNCPATDSLTVTVAPPPAPPVPCKELKPIDGIVLEFDQGIAGEAIGPVNQYRDKYDPKDPTKNLMKTYTDIADGDEVDFDGYAAADAKNDVDLLINFTDGTTAVSRFHRSCSDNEMNDLADCGTYQGDGKDNKSGLNTWILRNLLGNGKQLGCPQQP